MAPKFGLFLAPLVLLLSGCLSLERASACHEFAGAVGATFGRERPLKNGEDVRQLVQELAALERRIESWTSKSVWQGSELSVFQLELGVLERTLKEMPSPALTMEGHFGRRIGESVRRLKTSAERLRVFCSAP